MKLNIFSFHFHLFFSEHKIDSYWGFAVLNILKLTPQTTLFLVFFNNTKQAFLNLKVKTDLDLGKLSSSLNKSECMCILLTNKIIFKYFHFLCCCQALPSSSIDSPTSTLTTCSYSGLDPVVDLSTAWYGCIFSMLCVYLDI